MCLARNGDVQLPGMPSSPGIRMCLTGNAHSLYRVQLQNAVVPEGNCRLNTEQRRRPSCLV